MSFTLLKDKDVYLESIVESGSYVSGKWVEDDPEVSYEAFKGLPEPYTKAETSIVLPEGVKNSESFLLYTSKELYTHNDLDGIARTASIVYLDNPEEDDTAKPYVVFDAEYWDANEGFSLLTDQDYYYVLVRQDKLSS